MFFVDNLITGGTQANNEAKIIEITPYSENHVFATIKNYYHWTGEISIGTIISG